MSRVAVLGLGAMGRAIAQRLLGAGHDLSVWNRTPGADEGLVAAGARSASSAADAVRDAEVVITMVTDPPALEAVLFGPDGAASAMPRTATLIEMSTVGPTAIASVAERLGPVAVLDAPVLGSVPSVQSGTLVILAGGDRAVFDRHADLLSLLGKPIYAGPAGSGAWLKLVNNAASIATLVALGELLALTDRAGLGIDPVLQSLEAGPLASLIERWRPRLKGEDQASYFRLALARKDLAIVFDEAEARNTELTVAGTAAARCDEAIEAGLGDEDFGAVVPFLRRQETA
ncbi:MAG TPA: NAD(P)-dependent oxidoreductase [Actinomycetota bacterium]|nr:NAD(P)-dependent oxidoreductase [Actinomycetota bacterium]